jgi:flagellar motility protein MotE (MotC chaperone)
MKPSGKAIASPFLGRMMLRAGAAAGAFSWRPSLLAMTAGVATVAAVANGMAAGSAAEPAPPTRMGVSIQQSVSERNQAIARQQRGLDLREQAMRAAQQRMRSDMDARQGAGQDRNGPVNGSGNPATENPQPYDDLARIYQTMKPARAAPIFERLDLDVQVQIAKRMRERSTALILSSMSPAAAVQLSMALAGRRMAPPPIAIAPPPRPVPASAPRPSAEHPTADRPRRLRVAPLPGKRIIASAEPQPVAGEGAVVP